MVDLVDRGLIRILDLSMIRKDDDELGNCLQAADVEGVEGLEELLGASTGLLDADDLQEAATALEPGTRRPYSSTRTAGQPPSLPPSAATAVSWSPAAVSLSKRSSRRSMPPRRADNQGTIKEIGEFDARTTTRSRSNRRRRRHRQRCQRSSAASPGAALGGAGTSAAGLWGAVPAGSSAASTRRRAFIDRPAQGAGGAEEPGILTRRVRGAKAKISTLRWGHPHLLVWWTPRGRSMSASVARQQDQRAIRKQRAARRSSSWRQRGEHVPVFGRRSGDREYERMSAEMMCDPPSALRLPHAWPRERRERRARGDEEADRPTSSGAR